MSGKGMIVYLEDDQRTYLAREKQRTGAPMTDLIRDAIDLQMEMRAAATKPKGKLAEALAGLVEAMEPGELQAATKAIWAISEAYKAGASNERRKGRKPKAKENLADAISSTERGELGAGFEGSTKISQK